nr:glutathione S-transferase family protein [Lautropia mirabilis]
MPFFVKPIARKITGGTRENFLNPQLKLHLDFVEQKLQGNTAWLLGDTLTGADIMMSFLLQAALSRTDLALPNIAAYVRRVESHPDYQKAEAKLGKLILL